MDTTPTIIVYKFGKNWYNNRVRVMVFNSTFNNILKNTHLVEDLPMIIPGQFGFNYPSGFREEAL